MQRAWRKRCFRVQKGRPIKSLSRYYVVSCQLERNPCPCVSQFAPAIMFVLWAVTRPDTLTNCIIASKPADGGHGVAVVTVRVHLSLPLFIFPGTAGKKKPEGTVSFRSLTWRRFRRKEERSRKQESKIQPGLPDRLIARVLICETPGKDRSSDS